MTKKYKFLFLKFITALIILNGCNPRLEATMVNARIRKSYLKNKLKISKTYVKKVPAKIRSGVSNHLQWMDTPNTIINSALQTEMENSILASAKFLLNGLTLVFYDLD